MGNKSTKEKGDSNRVTNKRKGPLPNVPSADEVIVREQRRKDKPHESDILTPHAKEEFKPGAQVIISGKL